MKQQQFNGLHKLLVLGIIFLLVSFIQKIWGALVFSRLNCLHTEDFSRYHERVGFPHILRYEEFAIPSLLCNTYRFFIIICLLVSFLFFGVCCLFVIVSVSLFIFFTM